MIKRISSRIKVLYDNLKNSLKRFPETALFALAVVIVGIILNHTPYDQNETQEMYQRILLVVALGLPIFSTVKLAAERLKGKKNIRWILDIVSVAFLLLFYFLLPEEIDNEFGIKYALLSISLYLVFTLVPYFYKREKYSLYMLKLVTNFFTTMLFSLVLVLGFNAIILTIERLFELNFSGDIYGDIFIIVGGLFAPIHFLAQLPEDEHEMDEDYFPRILSILFMYIVIPLITIYTTILYAYFIRLIVIREFPINLLGHLVVWYGLVSTIVLFFINKIKDKKDFIKSFYRYFPIVILIPLGMLFLAIGSRVMDFGITPRRYFVIISGLWILGNMLYIFFSKKFKSSVLVITAVIVLLVSAYGPQSAFSLSLSNQENRFEKVLTESGMLQDGQIVSNKDLDQENKTEISEFVRYFDRYHGFEDIDVLPEGFKLENMKDVFGFEYYYYYEKMDDNYINYYYRQQSYISEVKGYDYMINFNSSLGEPTRLENEDISIQFDDADNVLKINKNGELLGELDMEGFTTEFHNKRNGVQPETINEATEYIELEKVDLKIIVRNMNVDLDNDFESGYFDFIVLIKIK